MKDGVDVLIVGAGPTGLSLACDLILRDRSVRLIDKKVGPSTIMKATVLTPASLEFLDQLGVADRMRETGTAVRNLTIYAEGKVVVRRGWEHVDAPFPFMLLLGQHHTERLLNDHLAALGGTVEWQTELKDFATNADGIVASVHTPAGEVTGTATYLVGCDGGHSTVATGLNTAYHDLDFPTDYLIAEIEIETDLARDDWHVFFHRAGPLAVGAMPGGLWGVMAALPPRADGQSRIGTEPTLQDLQAIWNERSPVPGKMANPRWTSFYRTHLRSAESSIQPPVFLAGDAAHQVSPLSSMGMNAGILDARNLGWKLDLACRGLAGPDLLTSYENEHRKEVRSAKVLSVLNEITYPMRAKPLRLYRDWSYRILLNFDPVWDFYVKYQSQKDRNLRRSPIVAQHVGPPVHLPSSPHLSDHMGCLPAWIAFGEGPHPGDPARDVPGLFDPATGNVVRLFEKLRGDRHVLMVFSACEDLDAEMWTNYRDINAACATLPEGFLRTIFIHRGTERPPDVWTGDVLLDPVGASHACYGAEAECLYLIRPDGYVGYRGLPPIWSPLADYLAKTFGISPSRDT